MNRKLNIILSIITAFAFTTNAITVTDNSSKTAIETAIQNAADGETIYFDFDGEEVSVNGTITVSSIGKKIVIDGKNKRNNKSVVLNSTSHRLFSISGSDTEITFRNVKFTGADNNAVIISSQANITFDDCDFYNNHKQPVSGESNGALVINNANVKINHSRFVSNTTFSANGGGAITILNSAKVDITSSVFEDNCISVNSNGLIDPASGGGAISVASKSFSTLNIDNCRFHNNYAPNGGAIMLKGAPITNITNCSFTENTATHTSSTNNIHYGGGAIIVYSTNGDTQTSQSTPLYIANCTFANNSSSHRGGAIYFRGEVLSGATADMTVYSTLVNNTFVGNVSGIAESYSSSQATGGALFFISKTASGYHTMFNTSLVNNIFAHNYTIMSNSLTKRTTFNSTYHALDIANNIFSSHDDAAVNANADTNNNIVITNEETDFLSVFKSEVTNERFSQFTTASLIGLPEAAEIFGESKAVGAGTASYKSVLIPTTDASGAQRPSIPSIGALEPNSKPTNVIDSEIESLSVRKIGDQLSICNNTNQADILIFDMNGRILIKEQIGTTGSIDISTLSRGIYVARIENACFKFYK
ncbi:MAG: right-handed parallel beta-helix repeat-containing protein [Muribaculaceae bacterium]